MLRYFEIRAPRPDFTGRIGAVSFADGVARVSFDDDRDDTGMAAADEHRVQVGRSAVLFAQRRAGYQVREVDVTGRPVTRDAKPTTASAPGGDIPTRAASKADWVAYATSPAAGDKRLTTADADALTRDDLAEKFLGPKGA